jgi:channel protein (hemolysin III family)
MNELQHLGLYARELKKRLPRDVFEPVPARLLWALPHLTILVLGVLAILGTTWPLIAKLPISVLMGLSIGSLGFLAHEVLHGSVVKTAWLRDLIGGVLFSPFGLSPRLWRRWHNVEHHGHTQHPDLDPDAFDTLESYDGHIGVRFLGKLPPRVRSFLYFYSFTFWFSLHSLLILKSFRSKLAPRDRRVAYAQTITPYLVWLALLLVVGVGPFMLLFVLPVMVGNFLVIAYIATNHGLNPMTETNDPLVNSLSVRNPRWLDVLHLNFSHHVEHHVLPSVNPVHAPKVRAVLKELYPDRYRELPWGVALAELWRLPRWYGADRVSFVDPEGRVYPTLGYGLNPDLSRPGLLRRLWLAPREPVGSLTRWVGVGASLAFLVIMLLWARDNALAPWPFLVFGLSAVLLYAASAVYRSFRGSERAMTWMRRLDRSAVFLLAAGSFTPLAYFGLSGDTRTAALGIVWGVALAGMLLKLVALPLSRWISVALYGTILWVGALHLPHFVASLPTGALVWLGVGVILYGVGALTLALRRAHARDLRHPLHELWHLFMLAGTGATFAMALNLR